MFTGLLLIGFASLLGSSPNRLDANRTHSTTFFLTRTSGSVGPSLALDVSSFSDGTFENDWTNKSNALSDTDSGASASTTCKAVASGQYAKSYWLKLTRPNFGATVPSNATITRITVNAKGRSDIPITIDGSGNIKTLRLYFALLDSTGLNTFGHEHDFSSTSPETFNASPAAALWNPFRSWTPSAINGTSFGVAVQGTYEDEQGVDSTFRDVDLDWANVKVDYTTP